ncbi:MAG: 23S rRNA (uracil-5-)-methyltransferase RumA, partial [Gluconacetobacter diazotrophicus]|nr:23S rRNA (uracil-5-)-methyltransferase RumA [Gluconacetobacter diazotrophicus]
HLRDRFERIVGLEWDHRAVEAARRDAAPHEEYLCGDVGALLPDALARLPAEGGVLIVDPPAEGLAGPVRAAVAALPPAEMIYVSCNPATLARDLGALRSAYGIASVTPLDMFPQTAEIEAVVHLRRRGAPV